MKEIVSAHVASFSKRLSNLKVVAESIMPQVDRLHVYLNDVDSIPEFLEGAEVYVRPDGDLGDRGKFYDHSASGYHLTIDDDILYPKDYAVKVIEAIERHNRMAVVSFHGRRFRKFPISSFDSRQECRWWSFRFTNDLDSQVHVCGTGVMAYHSETISFSITDFPESNMADVWVALKCARDKVPVFAVAKSAGWLRMQKGVLGEQIFDSRVRLGCEVETGLINKHSHSFL